MVESGSEASPAATTPTPTAEQVDAAAAAAAKQVDAAAATVTTAAKQVDAAAATVTTAAAKQVDPTAATVTRTVEKVDAVATAAAEKQVDAAAATVTMAAAKQVDPTAATVTRTVEQVGSAAAATAAEQVDVATTETVAEQVDAAAKATPTAVLTAPLSLEGGLAAELQPANLVQRVLSLFGNVRPGSDLSHFQLPATFNLPKSQLQLYGEGIYCTRGDHLSRCSQGKDGLERLTAVVAWSISTTRPPIFGFAPYNPVLGETHHVSRGSLHLLMEQVSHNPPVTALHATDDNGEIELVWCQNPVPKFHGTSIEATVNGKRQVRLLKLGETYEVDCPNLLIRLLPSPSVEWSGTARIACKDSGLEAELCYYRSNSFMGFGGDSRCVKGKVFRSSEPEETLCEIDGHWDRTVSFKDMKTGDVSVLYDATHAIANLTTPEVKDQEGLAASESVLVWSEVSEAILRKDWEKASEEKRLVEDTARRHEKERHERGEVWMPKHFAFSQDKNGSWECWPLEKSVGPAPIIVPP